jgi:hypothetical protein
MRTFFVTSQLTPPLESDGCLRRDWRALNGQAKGNFANRVIIALTKAERQMKNYRRTGKSARSTHGVMNSTPLA